MKEKEKATGQLRKKKKEKKTETSNIIFHEATDG